MVRGGRGFPILHLLPRRLGRSTASGSSKSNVDLLYCFVIVCDIVVAVVEVPRFFHE